MVQAKTGPWRWLRSRGYRKVLRVLSADMAVLSHMAVGEHLVHARERERVDLSWSVEPRGRPMCAAAT